MAKKPDKPRTGPPLKDIKIETLGLPEPVVGVLADQLGVVTMLDVMDKTTGGNDWAYITNGLNERGSEIPRKKRDDAILELREKFTFAVDNAPEEAAAVKPKKKAKATEPEYVASYGKGTYQYELRASIVGKASAENKGPDSRESQCGVTCSIALNSGEGEGVIDPARALEYFHDVKLDIMIAEADAEQGSLEGMKAVRPPCYGVIEVAGPKFFKQHITFPVKLKGKVDQIDLAPWAKSEIKLFFNVIEKFGTQTDQARKKNTDPNQQTLASAA